MSRWRIFIDTWERPIAQVYLYTVETTLSMISQTSRIHKLQDLPMTEEWLLLKRWCVVPASDSSALKSIQPVIDKHFKLCFNTRTPPRMHTECVHLYVLSCIPFNIQSMVSRPSSCLHGQLFLSSLVFLLHSSFFLSFSSPSHLAVFCLNLLSNLLFHLVDYINSSSTHPFYRMDNVPSSSEPMQ